MSILSDKTEKNALRIVAKTLRFFDELALCQMTMQDDGDVSLAKRLLSGVIENGGYRAVYQRRKGTKLIKMKRV